MGSQSDLEVMQQSARMLEQLQIAFEKRIISAHRTPEMVHEYASTARERGIRVIIAGAGGAAHLPGMLAASVDSLQVHAVPIPSTILNGIDSLLSIVQMPKGIPVCTHAIGIPGAINAALAAAALVAETHPAVLQALRLYRQKLRAAVQEADRGMQGE